MKSKLIKCLMFITIAPTTDLMTSLDAFMQKPRFILKQMALVIILMLFTNMQQVLTLKCEHVDAANELEAFSDLMDLHEVKHGIIVDDFAEKLSRSKRNALIELTSRKPLQFFDLRKFHNSSDALRQQNDFLGMFSEKQQRVAVFVSNMEDDIVQQFIFQPISLNNLFNYTQTWFVMSSKIFSDEFDFRSHIEEIFLDLKVYINADVTIAFRNAHELFHLFDVYRAYNDPQTELQIELKGNWSKENGLNLLHNYTVPFMKRRTNFQGIKVNAGVVMSEKPKNMETISYLENNKDVMHLEPYVRKVFQLMKLLEPMYNFSMNVVITPDWSSYKNGTWNGVIAQLNAREVEFAPGPTRITIHRAQFARFTSELHRECMRFIFRHPKHSEVRNIFFEPFSNEVWWSVLIMSILMMLLLVLNVRQEFGKQKQHKNDLHLQIIEPIESGFDFVFLRALEAIFMQGPSPDMFNLSSTRLLFTAMSIFSLMLLQFYSGFIVGSLVSDAPRTITTPMALYKSNLKIGTEGVAFNVDALKNSSDPYSRALYFEKIMSNPDKNILDMEEGLNRVKSGGFAYHIGIDSAYRYLMDTMTGNDFCELQTIVAANCLRSSAATLRNSSIREHIATAVIYFRETGIMQHNEKQWLVDLPDCHINEEKEVAVDLEHFAPALVFLGVAIVASALMLLLEFIAYHCERKKRQLMRNTLDRGNH